MKPIYYVARHWGGRFDRYLSGEGPQTVFDRKRFQVLSLEEATKIAEDLDEAHHQLGWVPPADYLVHEVTEYHACLDGSNVLNPEANEWSRKAYFTAAYDGERLRADRWTLPQLSRLGVIVIGRVGHYIGPEKHKVVQKEHSRVA